jgi:hypothetical protein
MYLAGGSPDLEVAMLDPKSLRERLIASRIATPTSISGCSAEEIDSIEEQLGLPLPRAYVEFLAVVGMRAGAFMRDVDIFYPKMFGLRARAEEMLLNWEEGKLSLPNNALVFAMRMGEQFMYFIADGKTDDPPIWFYIEEAGKFKEISESLWFVLESELRLSEDFRRSYPDSKLIPPPE